jgi:hypothetical protein
MRGQNKLGLLYLMSVTLTASSTTKRRIKLTGYLGTSPRLKTSVSDYRKVNFTVRLNDSKEFVLAFLIFSFQGKIL